MATHDLPTSGKLLGAVVRAFDLRKTSGPHGPLCDRTAESYLAGGRVSDRKEAEIRSEVAACVCKLLGSTNAQDGLDDMLACLAHHWDELAGELRSRAAPVERQDLMAVFYLRLAVIELALRAAGAAFLTGFEPANETPPLWAREGGRPLLLLGLQRACGPKQSSRTKLAQKFRVEKSAVDKWLSKARPKRDNLRALAAHYAELREDRPSLVLARLEFHYAMFELANDVCRVVGRRRTEELASKFSRYLHELLDGLRRQEGAKEVAAELLEHGSSGVAGTIAVRWLWEYEEDWKWQTELAYAIKPWSERLRLIADSLAQCSSAKGQIMERLGFPEDQAETLLDLFMEQVLFTDSALSHVNVPEGHKLVGVKSDGRQAEDAGRQGDLALMRQDFAEAEIHYRRATELAPEEAKYWFALGCVQWQQGKPDKVEEAVFSLWMAVKWREDWDRPRAEIGVVYFNTGRVEEAAAHLEQSAKELPEMTPYFAHVLGHARMGVGRFAEALDAFKITLKDNPRHALALDLAARCALEIGDRRTGRQWAKEARALGASTTYDALRRGEFDRGKGQRGTR